MVIKLDMAELTLLPIRGDREAMLLGIRKNGDNIGHLELEKCMAVDGADGDYPATPRYGNNVASGGASADLQEHYRESNRTGTALLPTKRKVPPRCESGPMKML